MTRRSFAALAFSLLTLFAASTQAAKRVHLENLDQDIDIHTRVRHTTIIVLPEQEKILDYVTGDSETWALSGVANFAYIKPGEEGARTNIALVCESGRVYSFRVYEDEDVDPDLVVYVSYEPLLEDNSKSKRPVPHEPKFISHMDVAIYQEAAEQAERNAREAWDQAERRMQQAIDQFRSTYPTLIRFEYTLEKAAGKSPFEIAGMWHDGRFTYVRSQAVEAPALYETRDGKPSLVAYDLTPDGLYIVNRVLEDGHFQIGREKAKWKRERLPRQPDPQLVQGRISLAAPQVIDATAKPAAEVDQ